MAITYRFVLACLRSALLIFPLAGWGQVPEDHLLVNQKHGALSIGLSDGYEQRLEVYFPYQQALLPKGVTSSQSYWVHEGQKYPLVAGDVVHWRDDISGRAQSSSTQEFYSPIYLNGRWRPAFISHYSEMPDTGPADVRGLMPATQNYQHAGGRFPLQGDPEPEDNWVHKNFDPLRLVEGLVPNQPASACFFYVLDTRPATWGDTLLSYRLQGGSADSTYHLELLRRRKEQTRRWLGNNKLIQAWDYTPRTRLLTSILTNGRQWTRQYGKGQDFVEILTESGRYGGPGIRSRPYSRKVYERRRTYTVGHTRDQYTVTYSTAEEDYYHPTAEVKLTISTDFN